MVLDGRVREVDRLGNDAADEAADFSRRRVCNAVIDARRDLSGTCGRWYPVLLDLHRFFIAISRAVVNHDGGDGTTPDPLVWSAGALTKRRRLVHSVRDRAFLPGPPVIWDSEWVNILASAVSAEDIAHWHKNPGLLVNWVSFSGSLHWPAGGLDLGVGGISYVELLILYELWAGERLSLEKAHPRYLRPGRPISVSAVPFCPGIEIWRSCRFICALMRSLCLLPGGLGRFVPCSIGANLCEKVVMDLLLGLGRVPQELSWISCCCYFSILLDPPVRCLMGHSLFGTVLLSLLVGFLFGLHLYLVMLLDWLLLRFRLLKLMRLRLPVGRFIGLVFLVLVVKETEKKPSTPRGTIYACSSTCMDEVELFWVFWYLRC